MTDPTPDPRARHRLLEALDAEDVKLMDILGLIRADERAGRIPAAEAEMDVQGARDAHTAACRKLREQFERGEL